MLRFPLVGRPAIKRCHIILRDRRKGGEEKHETSANGLVRNGRPRSTVSRELLMV